MPPFQTALDHGIQPSLSVDVECNMTADMFSIMRSTFTLQPALVNERSLAGEQNLPPLVTCREVIEMATIAGRQSSPSRPQDRHPDAGEGSGHHHAGCASASNRDPTPTVYQGIDFVMRIQVPVGSRSAPMGAPL
jgi:hypothetical protein